MNMTATIQVSPFLHPGPTSIDSSLAILGLRRDHLIPTILEGAAAPDTGYAEGTVTNTRFGSFPHSTLTNVPWGSQILASAVDTGSRGRKPKASNAAATKKRKHADISAAPNDDLLILAAATAAAAASDDADNAKRQRTAVAATSGFCHLLPPTPEAWTLALPHRTQVVYTPDYSTVLQRMHVRPGAVIIEAGAGSGSFTHAAARAVFSGYPDAARTPNAQPRGRVYSYEYHENRVADLQRELASHGLASLVCVTHRDVYTHGFMLPRPASTIAPTDAAPTTAADIAADAGTVAGADAGADASPATSPLATAIFLDLPAPWLALPHLTRAAPSPLAPHAPVHLTAFLPCIEQAQRAIVALRAHGWVELHMCEVAHRRLDVRRERTGLHLEGLRGVNASAADVEEAVRRQREVEERGRAHREAAAAMTAAGAAGQRKDGGGGGGGGGGMAEQVEDGEGKAQRGDKTRRTRFEGKQTRLARLKNEEHQRKTFLQGRLVHRVEPELKTHTSYLVFAVLPREWTAEDEAGAAAHWAQRGRRPDNEK